MREIKFRGWCDRLKRWVYGSILSRSNDAESYIVTDEYKVYYDLTNSGMSIEAEYDSCFEVEPDTVGQYTGMQDADGVAIYEGDIVNGYADADRVLDDWVDEEDPSYTQYLVRWKDGGFRICPKYYSGDFGYPLSGCSVGMLNVWKVVGNVHDNPNLYFELDETGDR